MLQIEKGVEMPEIKPWGRRAKYPLREMNVGDSFFVPCPLDKKKMIVQSITGSARQKRFPDKKFTSRSVEGGVRCWRYA